MNVNEVIQSVDAQLEFHADQIFELIIPELFMLDLHRLIVYFN